MFIRDDKAIYVHDILSIVAFYGYLHGCVFWVISKLILVELLGRWIYSFWGNFGMFGPWGF